VTAFSDVYDKFYELVETDSNFFQYFDLTENKVRDLVHDRAKSYLMESLSVITRNIEPEEDFSFDDYDSELEEFNSDLTFDEIDMLAHLMLEQHFKREFGKLKAFSAQDLPTSLQVFSPANERTSIRALVKDIHEENMTMLDNYMAKDRSTRKRKTIDYDTYASYSE
jgi:hypothetical protein